MTKKPDPREFHMLMDDEMRAKLKDLRFAERGDSIPAISKMLRLLVERAHAKLKS